MVEVNEKKRNVYQEKYSISCFDRKKIKISIDYYYSFFSYLNKEDEEKKYVDEKLEIIVKKEGGREFGEIIYLINDEVKVDSLDGIGAIGYSSVLDYLSKLESETQEIIQSAFSSNVKELFNKGVVYYSNFDKT